MKVKSVVVWHEEFPMKVNFKHALAERSTSSSIITKVELENGTIGYGECLPRPYVTGETIESCLKALKEVLTPKVLEKDFMSGDDLKTFILNLHDSTETEKDLTAICAVELALIDALSKFFEKNIYEFVGIKPKKKSIIYSMILSADNEEKMTKYVRLAKKLWIKNLKLKVTDSFEGNEKALQLIRNYYPKSVVRVDANCTWSVDEAIKQLTMMQNYNVVSCEQPIIKEDFKGLANLVSHFPNMKICVDESLCSYKDAKTLIDGKSTTLLNIRISKNGGLFNALRIYDYAKANGISCQMGAQVGETAILSFYGRTFAAIVGDLMFHEGSFGSNLLKEDIVKKKYAFGFMGKASAKPKGHGNFLKILPEVIERYKETSFHLPN